ncbi:MAG: hypothetical protein ABEH61_04020 [Haloarculaceae archaeon]
MSEHRDALLRAFVESDASPDGKWWVDVPVGLSVGGEADADDETETDGEYAVLDAVCLTSRAQELPEVYPEHTGTPYVVHTGDEYVRVSKVDSFRTLLGTDTFADETAVPVAVDPGASSVGAVGELLAYRELLVADWDWEIAELLLVSDTDSDHVTHVCDRLGVRAMRVA